MSSPSRPRCWGTEERLREQIGERTGTGLTAIAAVLMLVARPAAVFITLAPVRMPWREKLLVSWVGLRGAVPIILATFPLVAGVPVAPVLFNIVFFIVFASVLLQGTAETGARRRLTGPRLGRVSGRTGGRGGDARRLQGLAGRLQRDGHADQLVGDAESDDPGAEHPDPHQATAVTSSSAAVTGSGCRQIAPITATPWAPAARAAAAVVAVMPPIARPAMPPTAAHVPSRSTAV